MSADTVSGTLYNLEIPVPFPSAVRLQNQLSPRYGNSPGISCEKDEAWCQPRRNSQRGWVSHSSSDLSPFQEPSCLADVRLIFKLGHKACDTKQSG